MWCWAAVHSQLRGCICTKRCASVQARSRVLLHVHSCTLHESLCDESCLTAPPLATRHQQRVRDTRLIAEYGVRGWVGLGAASCVAPVCRRTILQVQLLPSEDRYLGAAAPMRALQVA